MTTQIPVLLAELEKIEERTVFKLRDDIAWKEGLPCDENDEHLPTHLMWRAGFERGHKEGSKRMLPAVEACRVLAKALNRECCCPGENDYAGKEILCDPCNAIALAAKIMEPK